MKNHNKDCGIAKGIIKAPITYTEIAELAKRNSESIAQWLLPAGKKAGHEWVALNPNRPDLNPGSFKVNLHSGKWADFATDDRGGDLISLVAYVRRVRQGVALRLLACFLGGVK